MLGGLDHPLYICRIGHDDISAKIQMRIPLIRKFQELEKDNR